MGSVPHIPPIISAVPHSSTVFSECSHTVVIFTDQMLARKDWSWRVRFAAVQGLVRICRDSRGDGTKDGIRGVAWNQLMRHHSQERDVRVLEAWKLAQVS